MEIARLIARATRCSTTNGAASGVVGITLCLHQVGTGSGHFQKKACYRTASPNSCAVRVGPATDPSRRRTGGGTDVSHSDCGINFAHGEGLCHGVVHPRYLAHSVTGSV